MKPRSLLTTMTKAQQLFVLPHLSDDTVKKNLFGCNGWLLYNLSVQKHGTDFFNSTARNIKFHVWRRRQKLITDCDFARTISAG